LLHCLERHIEGLLQHFEERVVVFMAKCNCALLRDTVCTVLQILHSIAGRMPCETGALVFYLGRLLHASVVHVHHSHHDYPHPHHINTSSELPLEHMPKILGTLSAFLKGYVRPRRTLSPHTDSRRCLHLAPEPSLLASAVLYGWSRASKTAMACLRASIAPAHANRHKRSTARRGS
jgi:hypothetical protein